MKKSWQNTIAIKHDKASCTLTIIEKYNNQNTKSDK